jgi:hypothetical protein
LFGGDGQGLGDEVPDAAIGADIRIQGSPQGQQTLECIVGDKVGNAAPTGEQEAEADPNEADDAFATTRHDSTCDAALAADELSPKNQETLEDELSKENEEASDGAREAAGLCNKATQGPIDVGMLEESKPKASIPERLQSVGRRPYFFPDLQSGEADIPMYHYTDLDIAEDDWMEYMEFVSRKAAEDDPNQKEEAFDAAQQPDVDGDEGTSDAVRERDGRCIGDPCIACGGDAETLCSLCQAACHAILADPYLQACEPLVIDSSSDEEAEMQEVESESTAALEDERTENSKVNDAKEGLIFEPPCDGEATAAPNMDLERRSPVQDDVGCTVWLEKPPAQTEMTCNSPLDEEQKRAAVDDAQGNVLPRALLAHFNEKNDASAPVESKAPVEMEDDDDDGNWTPQKKRNYGAPSAPKRSNTFVDSDGEE